MLPGLQRLAVDGQRRAHRVERLLDVGVGVRRGDDEGLAEHARRAAVPAGTACGRPATAARRRRGSRTPGTTACRSTRTCCSMPASRGGRVDPLRQQRALALHRRDRVGLPVGRARRRGTPRAPPTSAPCVLESRNTRSRVGAQPAQLHQLPLARQRRRPGTRCPSPCPRRQVGRDPVQVRRAVLGPAETGDRLVEDEHGAELVAERADALEVAGGGLGGAAGRPP